MTEINILEDETMRKFISMESVGMDGVVPFSESYITHLGPIVMQHL